MSRRKTESRDDVPDTSHAFADRTHRFARDTLLRSHGFKIHARPRKGPDIWVLGDVLFTFDEALRRIPKSQVANAIVLEFEHDC